MSRYGYERELMTLLNQLCRDMNRKIERQKERAIIESSARPLNAEDKARLDAIKVRMEDLPAATVSSMYRMFNTCQSM